MSGRFGGVPAAPIEVNVNEALVNGGEVSEDDPIGLPIDASAFWHVGGLIACAAFVVVGFVCAFIG